jgi:uncharacterized protein YjdB
MSEKSSTFASNYEDSFNKHIIIMKKIFSILALALFSAMSWAAVSISVTPSNVDFGTQSIKGKTSVEGSTIVNVNYSGLLPSCGVVFEDVEMPAENAAFWLDGTKTSGWIYGGDDWNPKEGPELTLHYYAEKAGTYTGKIRFYSYTDSDWKVESESVYLTMTLVVTDDAIVGKTIPFERVNTTSDLKDGDTIVFVCESAGAVCGPLEMPILTSVTENVTIDKTAGTAKVPEATAQLFKANKYSDGWQFVTADAAKNRLHLDIEYNNAKGAFTYADAAAGKILATWGVYISNGVADVTRNDNDGTYPVRWQSGGSGDRFKPYKSGDGSSIAIYKKAGKAEELQSTVTISPATIEFEDTEMEETAEVTVTYTAENLTDDIVWGIEGTNSSWFNLVEAAGNDNTSGTLTIQYKGNGTKTGSVSAQLSYLTQNAQMDPMEGSYPINLTLKANTIKLTKLEFTGAPTQIEQGQSIDMSKYLVFTPNDAEDKSLTWTTDHDYQGTVDANGVLTAKHVTGTVTVTATSVRMPSVSASATLKIEKPVVTDFTLSDTEVTLNVGGTKQLSVAARVPEYAIESATYTSKNTTIATVNKNGVITAKAIGETEITATIGEVVKTCKVNVVAVTVEKIELPVEADLTIGSSLQLDPVVTPAQAATEYSISYESDKESVATVNESGMVKGIAEGDAVITATISDKSAQITIHVKAAKTFAKVMAPGDVAEKDTIILALESVPVVAGARDGKKLTVLTSEVTVTENEAYADNACRMVLGTEKGKSGFTLTIVGGKTIAVNSDGNDILDANTKNCKFWEFVADGNNGIFVRNLGNTNAMFKYHAGNAAIKPYKLGTTGAVYVYAYVRKYVDPNPPTGMEEVQGDNVQSTKELRNGQIVILRGDKAYTITGQELR